MKASTVTRIQYQSNSQLPICKVRSTLYIPKTRAPTCALPRVISWPILSRHGRPNVLHSDAVRVDTESMLPAETRAQFIDLLQKYDNVYNPLFSGYNGVLDTLKSSLKWVHWTCTMERQSSAVLKWPACHSARNVQWTREHKPFLSSKKSKWWISSGYSICRRRSIQQAPAHPYTGCKYSTLRQITQWKYVI